VFNIFYFDRPSSPKPDEYSDSDVINALIAAWFFVRPASDNTYSYCLVLYSSNTNNLDFDGYVASNYPKTIIVFLRRTIKFERKFTFYYKKDLTVTSTKLMLTHNAPIITVDLIDKLYFQGFPGKGFPGKSSSVQFSSKVY